jgi:hypothetical protein
MRILRWLLCCTALGLAAGVVHAQTGLKPPATKSKPKAAAKSEQGPTKAEEDSAGAEAVEKIFACLAAGLPPEWRRAWVVVTELEGDTKERRFEGKFYYSPDPRGAKPMELKPCDAREVAQGVYRLNDFLEPEKRQWKVATLTFTRDDGKFELKYDYAK